MTHRCRDYEDLLIAATVHELPAADRERLTRLTALCGGEEAAD